MPVIHSTDYLHEMHRKLLIKYPDRDVILLQNGVMCYAFDASARAIYRMDYPHQRPRNHITLATAGIQRVIDRLVAGGLSVGLCDLDTPAE